MNVKIAYKDSFASFDEEEAKVIPLDDLKADYPWECIEYALKNNLLKCKGWEWINDYVGADKDLVQMVHTYRISTFRQYKYGVELPQSYKHARQLDEKNNNKLWQAAINKENWSND